MTRKDVELIAAALREARFPGLLDRDDVSHDAGIDEAARSLARSLATTNPRFDHDRFLTACGVPL